MKQDLQQSISERIAIARTHRLLIAAGLFCTTLAIYHANGGFLVGRDPTASVYLPLSLLEEGNLSFTPEEMPQMFAWEYRAAKGPQRVRFDRWDQKARDVGAWVTNGKSARLTPLGEVEPSLSAAATCRDLLRSKRLTPIEPDYYLVPSVDPARRGYVNTFGPGTGLTATPWVAVQRMFVKDLGHNKKALWYGAKFVASCCVAMSVALVYLAAVELVGSWPAAAIALIYGLATCVWSVSSQALWQSGPNVMFLALAAWCLLRIDRNDFWAAPCALAAASAVLCRPTSALVVIAIGAYLAAIGLRRWRTSSPAVSPLAALRPLVVYVLAGLPLAVWLGYHNAYYLGSPLVLGDMVASRALARLKVGSPDVWSGSFFEGFWGLLISPSRGLLVYSPVAGFAIWGAIRVWRDRDLAALRPLSAAAAMVLVLSSKWYDWAGGWSFGYRLLVDTMPLLALCSVAVAPIVWRRTGLQALLLVTLLWSLGVQGIGAFAYDVTGWNNRPAYVVRTAGQSRPLVLLDRTRAEQLAQRERGSVQAIFLDIDRKPYHRRLWSIADSPLVYYLTHFSQSRANKQRMVEEFVRERI